MLTTKWHPVQGDKTGFQLKEVLIFIFRTLDGAENEDDDLEGKEESSDSVL